MTTGREDDERAPNGDLEAAFSEVMRRHGLRFTPEDEDEMRRALWRLRELAVGVRKAPDDPTLD